MYMCIANRGLKIEIKLLHFRQFDLQKLVPTYCIIIYYSTWPYRNTSFSKWIYKGNAIKRAAAFICSVMLIMPVYQV